MLLKVKLFCAKSLVLCKFLFWSYGIAAPGNSRKCKNNEVQRFLTSKRRGFVGTESIVRLGEETTGGACSSAAKKAGRCATRCTKAEAGAGGGGGRLAECAGAKQSACGNISAAC